MKNGLLIAILLCGLSTATTGIAQDKLTLGDLKSNHAQRLSQNELQLLVPEAQVVNISGKGSERRWKNNKNGTLIATSTNTGAIGVSNSGSTSGTWSINEEGRYCVEIDWPREPEKWCRAIYRLGEAYYGVSSLKSDTTRANRFEFSK